MHLGTGVVNIAADLRQIIRRCRDFARVFGVLICLCPPPALTLPPLNPVPPACPAVEGQCPQPELCPLSAVKAGTVVCIKQLDASPDVKHRLRELGMREEQRIRLVSRQSTYICQVCNARLGLSAQLADNIMVETVPAPTKAA